MLDALLRALDQGYLWICRQRNDYPAHADVWDLRFHWHSERVPLESELRAGCFRFGPLQIITRADGEVPHLWRARDALVMKALTLVLTPRIRLSSRCVHIKGYGGLKAAVRAVQQRLTDYGHVLRTDMIGSLLGRANYA